MKSCDMWSHGNESMYSLYLEPKIEHLVHMVLGHNCFVSDRLNVVFIFTRIDMHIFIC